MINPKTDKVCVTTQLRLKTAVSTDTHMLTINEVIFLKEMAVWRYSCVGYGNDLKKRVESKKRKAHSDGFSALLLPSGSSKAVTIVIIRNGSKSRWSKDKD